MKIYKVRYLDLMGVEVAEFGFYESRTDAIKRANEVLSKLKGNKGSLDIREINVIEDSNKQHEISEKDFYDIK